MASIAHDKNGTRRLLFVDADGQRQPIRLGRMTAREAENFKRRVELLVIAKMTGDPIDTETARWVKELSKP